MAVAAAQLTGRPQVVLATRHRGPPTRPSASTPRARTRCRSWRSCRVRGGSTAAARRSRSRTLRAGSARSRAGRWSSSDPPTRRVCSRRGSDSSWRGRPGPIALVLPEDLLDNEVSGRCAPRPRPRPAPRPIATRCARSSSGSRHPDGASSSPAAASSGHVPASACWRSPTRWPYPSSRHGGDPTWSPTTIPATWAWPATGVLRRSANASRRRMCSWSSAPA